MNTPAVLTGLGCGGAAGLLFHMAKKELSFKKKTGQLTLTHIRDVKPGLCLTAGKVLCEAPLRTPYTETPAVWYRYGASERRIRKGKNASGYYDHSLASGSRNCRFVLKDETGEIEIIPEGGTAVSYSHLKILKSQSGSRKPIGDRIKRLKAVDSQNYPEGQKKPFFRKIDMEAEPLDIPDDLVELEPGSSEARNAHRKYSENWIQPGDYVYLLGWAAEGDNTPMIISKPDKSSPFLLSAQMQDITTKAFQKNFIVLSLVGLGLGVVGLFLLLMGVGILRTG